MLSVCSRSLRIADDQPSGKPLCSLHSKQPRPEKPGSEGPRETTLVILHQALKVAGSAIGSRLAVDRAVEVVILLVLVLRLLLDVGWAWSWRGWEHTKGLKCLLCSILSGVVDVLAVVPEASWELGALHSDHAAPSCAAA